MTHDDRYLLAAIELARRAREHGNHPVTVPATTIAPSRAQRELLQ